MQVTHRLLQVAKLMGQVESLGDDEKEREGEREKRKLAGWVARTRPLSGPLSPRGPQPVLERLKMLFARLNGSAEP